MLQRGPTSLERLDALNMVRALPPESQARLGLATLDKDARTSLDLAYNNAEIRDAHGARSVSSKIAEAAQTATEIDYLVGQDQMLHRLVREALFHVDHGRRHQAALVLAASPYRAQLGEPLVALAARTDETTAVLATTALFQLADQRQRGALLQAGLADPRLAVRTTSLMSLGQVVGQIAPEEAVRLRTLLAEPGPAALRSAAMHVLGMGSADLLVELADGGPDADAARWWLESPRSSRRWRAAEPTCGPRSLALGRRHSVRGSPGRPPGVRVPTRLDHLASGGRAREAARGRACRDPRSVPPNPSPAEFPSTDGVSTRPRWRSAGSRHHAGVSSAAQAGGDPGRALAGQRVEGDRQRGLAHRDQQMLGQVGAAEALDGDVGGAWARLEVAGGVGHHDLVVLAVIWV